MIFLTKLVNGVRNGANNSAVKTLKIVFSIAFAKTGSLSISIIIQVTLISCQNSKIPISAEITLNKTCARLSCLLDTAPPSEAITQVIVVPILDHITIAIDAGKVIILDANAAKVITLIAELDWIISVTMTHIRPNPQRDISLYAARSKLAFSASTLSFIKPIPINSKPNQTNNFPIHLSFSFLFPSNIMIPPTQMIGRAKADILNSQNHKYETKIELTVVHILAQIITQILFCNEISHAPKNHSNNKVTRELLCRTQVTTVHILSDFTAPLVYFSR